MNKSRKVIGFIDRFSELLSGHLMGWLIMALMVMILMEVLTRYILQSPLAVADEMGGYILVAVTMIGLAYTWQQNGHVRVELLVNKLPEPLRLWIRLITVILAVVFTLIMIKASVDLVSQTILFGRRSGSWMRTPLKWPQLALIVGSVMLFIQLIAEFLKAVINLRNVGRNS